MKTWILPAAVGLVCGVISGFGVGGGSLLMVYMTAVANLDQRLAQGINLLYFLPTALAAILFHAKHKLIDWRAVLPSVLCGCATAVLFSVLAMRMDLDLLKKLFGIFLILTGITELLHKDKHQR